MGKTPAITIDRMRKSDLDQVMDIENASFTMPWSRNLFLAEFRNNPLALMLAAHYGGEERVIAGYIVCWVFVDELHILDLAAAPEYRRRGIGKRLVLSALRQAYEGGARKAFLEVRESNSAAIELYRDLGFEQVHVREGYYDLPVENAVVMKLETERLRQLLLTDEEKEGACSI